MSSTKSTSVGIWCDSPECRENFYEQDISIPQVRKKAKERGWKYRSGEDFCPVHAAVSK